ncbi:MAG: beta-galactosidase [Candidatus Cyclobacteriaceae bacterium M3_2C_046]
MKNIWIILIFFLSPLLHLSGQNSDENFFNQEMMPIGAYYYPEHWPSEQWEWDLTKMADLGFQFTHFGEFAWSMMEPEEGKFNFEWLDRAVSLANKNGLKVIMCTPTPTPPAWLTHKHPEILIVNDQGIQQQHGSRLHVSYNHPVYLDYVEKIVTELGRRYGQDDRIWGWQLDNEPHYGTLYDYSDYQENAFQQWLQQKYHSIDQLNKAWGAAFWSQNYNDFSQIQIPNAKKAPQGANQHALLDFQRFTADELAQALRFQANILRKLISSDQWITTNYAYFKFLPSVDLFRNRDDLDFASHTMYLLSTALNYPEGRLGHRLGSGLELAFSNEMAKSVNGYTGIMELQPGQINWGQYNAQPLPGAVKMWIWHSFALGDEFTCTYRFRQPLFGSEQFHKGILEPDGITVSPGGKEYLEAISEIKSLSETSAKEPNEYAGRRTAFLWNQDNLWDIENYRHHQDWDTWQHYYRYYEILKMMGAPVTFLTEQDEFDQEKYPFMVAPAYQLVNDQLIDRWKNYVQKGGHLILTSRTGMKDKKGHLWEKPLQAPVYDLIGARIKYYDHLPPGQKGQLRFGQQSYDWKIWGDILEPASGETWATYQDQFYEGKSAIVHHKTGMGSVTYIGAWSDKGDLENHTLRQVFQQKATKVLDQLPYVFTEWRDGYWVTVNYRSEPVEAHISDNATILFGQKLLQPGQYVVWQEN